MKKVIKILLILLITICVINVNTVKVNAASILSDSISGGKSFIDASKDKESPINEDALQETSKSIYNTLILISFVVVAIVGIVLGIKFMMAGVEEKAQLKHALVIFLIGAAVAYGAFLIWKVMVNIFSGI